VRWAHHRAVKMNAAVNFAQRLGEEVSQSLASKLREAEDLGDALVREMAVLG